MTVNKLVYTETEIEQQRVETLEDNLPDGQDPSDYAPGSFGCHEALHMASHLCNQVDEELMGHISVLANPEWFRAAHEAHSALWHLYQLIGNKHLTPVINGEDLVDILKDKQPGLSRTGDTMILDFSEGGLDEAFDAAEKVIGS